MSQTPVPDNTQQSQEIDVYARGWIRTRNRSKRAAFNGPATRTGGMSFLCANTLFTVSPLLADTSHFALLSKDIAGKSPKTCIQCQH